MAINVADGFQYLGKKSLDARTQYATLADMKAVTDANINEGCLAYCSETDKYYKFLSTNDSDEETGKWREYESGGGLIEGYAVPVFGTNNEFVALLNEATGYEFPSYNDDAHTAFMAGIGMSQYPNEMAIFLFNTNDSYRVERINTTQIRITNKGGHAISFESATSVPPNGSWGHAGVNIYGQSTTTEGVSGMDTIYIRGNITISDNNFVRLPDPLKFYEDKEHTIEIVPEIGKQYIDKSTNKMYRWNGISYVCINGEFDDSTLYSIEDEAETAIADADYFPFYDVSASTKKKSLWSNIKSVLKTYFDSLYNPKLTAGTSIQITDNNVINAQMPVMGTFSKGDLYDTSEKVIGKWTDGRPLYQRTYSGTIPSSDGTQALFSLPSSYCRVMYAEGCAFWDGTNYISIPFATESSSKADHAGLYTYNNTMYIDMTDTNSYFRGKSYYVTIRYIKTSDSTNSYNYSSENDYSTSEKVIGTWIGGQTLYQKTYSITTPSTAYSDTEMFSISGMYVKSVDGVICWQGASSTSIVPLVYANGGGNASSIVSSCMVYTASNKFCMKINDSDCLSKPAYVTLKYTKT